MPVQGCDIPFARTVSIIARPFSVKTTLRVAYCPDVCTNPSMFKSRYCLRNSAVEIFAVSGTRSSFFKRVNVFGATRATLIPPVTTSVRRIRFRIGRYFPRVSVRIFFMYQIISYRIMGTATIILTFMLSNNSGPQGDAVRVRIRISPTCTGRHKSGIVTCFSVS